MKVSEVVKALLSQNQEAECMIAMGDEYTEALSVQLEEDGSVLICDEDSN